MAIDENNPYRVTLRQLLRSIDDDISFEERNLLLILHVLDSEEKIIRFAKWVGDNLVDDKVNASEEDIVRAAVRASQEQPVEAN